MLMRSMISNVFFTLVLAGVSLPAAAQSDLIHKQSPEVTHNAWTSGAAMPTAVSFEMTGVIKGSIYVVGGYTASAVVANNQIYDIATNSWSSGPALPSATAQGASAVVKNVLYVFGGSNNGGGAVTNAVWAYNPRRKPGPAKAAMPTATRQRGRERGKEHHLRHRRLRQRRSAQHGRSLQSRDQYLDRGSAAAGREVGAGGRERSGPRLWSPAGYAQSGDDGDNEGYNVATNSWTSFKADPTSAKRCLLRLGQGFTLRRGRS